MKNLLIVLISVLAIVVAQAQQKSEPLVFADYSDPDVCMDDNGDFWMTSSSFQCMPGLPILHSRDMVNWTHANYAVEKLLPEERYATVQHGCGVWAPSIRFHKGTYYIYWGDPDYGIYMVKTTNPRGKWDTPVLVVPGKGLIDPCPLWDEDGRVYLVNGWANSRCGFNSVLTIRELSADGTTAIGNPVLVYDGQVEGNHTVEGPKLYKHEGHYYILAPAGGVAQGWQLALRSKSIYGPYESKVVYNSDGVHQGGMAADKFICFRETGAYGRILHLLDVEWKNGWPMMKARSKKAERPSVQPHSGYQWHANYQDTFGFPLADGRQRIYGHHVEADYRSLWEVPNLWLKKFEGETFSDTLRLVISAKAEGEQSGFVIMGRDYCGLSAELRDGHFVLKRILCKDADKGEAETSETIGKLSTRTYGAGAKQNYETTLHVIIRCDKGALCTMSYSTDGKRYNQAGQPFQAREGKWIGAKYGVFSIAPDKTSRGWVDMEE